MSLQSWARADIGALAALWARCFPAKYHVDPEVLAICTTDSPLFDWGASCLSLRSGEPCAFVGVKRSAARLYKGPDQDQAHVTALCYLEPQVAVDLMEHVKRVLIDRGVYKLVFGADHRHVFPGCPLDCPSLRDFLIIEGFQEGEEVYDLEQDLRQYKAPERTEHAERSLREITPELVGPLRAFLNREFPGRWSYDVFAKIAAEERSDFIIGSFVGDRCDGFVMTQDSTHRLPIGGAVWRHSLGENWGSLGPMGVAASARGAGVGDALLGHALSSMRERGVHRANVDWTTLVDFYGRHGFQTSRTYRSFELRVG